MQEQLKQLNDILFAELNSKEINIDKNKAINQTARTLISNFKVELEYKKLKANSEALIK